MSCKEWTRSIKGVNDVELGIPRTSELIYHCAMPEIEQADGLVFVIPGFGEDASGEIQRGLRTYLAETYNLLAVTVEYHCSRSGLSAGAKFSFTFDELGDLRKLCARHGISSSDPAELIAGLARVSEANELYVRLAPPNGDYQNFGVMQALDHLAVLADLLKQRVHFDKENIIALGASHGGYIAHMISKFAPNTLRAVIDNSSYTDPQRGLSLTTQINLGDSQLTLNCIVFHKWLFDDVTSPSYFLRGRMMIRHTSIQTEIDAMHQFSLRPCQYRMLHSPEAELEPVEYKRLQAQRLQQAGFDVILEEVTEPDVDGTPVKNLVQGMDSSLRAMFDHFYPTLVPNPGKLDSELDSEIGYFCDDYYYSFLHGRNGCAMRVVPVPTKPEGRFYGQLSYGEQRIEFRI
jgi:hypothetical protein